MSKFFACFRPSPEQQPEQQLRRLQQRIQQLDREFKSLQGAVKLEVNPSSLERGARILAAAKATLLQMLQHIEANANQLEPITNEEELFEACNARADALEQWAGHFSRN
jgi:hypothetical protein